MKKKYTVAIIVLIILCGISEYYYFRENTTSKEIITLKPEAHLEALSKAFDHMLCLDDVMIEVEGSVLKTRSIDGSIHWSQKLDSKVSKILRAGKNFVVLDKNNRVICLNKQGKIIWQFKFEQTPIDIISDKYGFIMVEYKRNNISNIDVFDDKGIRAGTLPIENGYILSFASSGKDGYTVSLLDTSSDIIKSKIINLNKKGEIVWAVNHDNKLIPKVAYGPRDNIFLVDDKTIYKYRSDGKEIEKLTLDESIVGFTCDTDKLYAVLKYRNKYKLVIISEKFNILAEASLNEVPKGLIAQKTSVVLNYKDRVEVYDSHGNNTYVFNNASDIKDIFFTSDKNLYVISNNRMEVLEYK